MEWNVWLSRMVPALFDKMFCIPHVVGCFYNYKIITQKKTQNLSQEKQRNHF